MQPNKPVRVAALLLPCLSVAGQQDAAAVPAAAPGAGWVTLFDGKSTDQWRAYGAPDFPKAGWVLQDGALVHENQGGGGDIITRRQFGNFELEMQWRVAAKANSGVMFRVAESKEPPYVTGPECQVLDDGGHRDGANPATSAGSLYGLVAPEGKVLRPIGEWNDLRIVLVDDHLEHWLNAKKVVDVDFASDAYKASLGKSKFARWAGFNKHARGHISLQDHGDEVAFRNIRIRELPTKRLGQEVVLFDGKSLDAFAAHLNDGKQLADVWSIKDGVLVCKGQPAGYLYSKDRFTSYVLKVVWRFPPEKGGNSGVLLRMTGEHKVWPRSIEAQLQSGNAGDFWNIGEYPMQTEAGRRKGRNTKGTHTAEKPLGEWNEYEIVVDGPWVRLSVNGQVLNEAWDCEVIPGHICFQSEGVEIQFKDIRLQQIGG